ncbi:DUF418 domain-containing protein [Sphingomonas sp. TREG-RG-20F-R18-01]|uniref:DUF418 domain-containing protein n=1 Tax=Sphingomonas sp. TREG-RG-20F-R18-01 TaxID=2914982 RepID=UPI001F59A3A9|nr:DUF418 domain-containing protein [Sphingomonas sp. TREG-RG-20F-R18-01]
MSQLPRPVDPLAISVEPDGAPRIAVLDMLRGIAILGILFMNINDMGQSMTASFDDIRHLGWSMPDQIVWWIREVLAMGTARGMLEMLFGAGMVILTERLARQADESVVLRRYFTRNVILFLFGLVHVFVLLWPGDILHTYGLAALVAFLFRELRPRALLFLGSSMAMFFLIGGGMSYSVDRTNASARERVEQHRDAHAPLTREDQAMLANQAEQRKQRATLKRDSRARIVAEDKARTGTFATWAAQQWGTFRYMEEQGFELLFVWEAAATMLIGAGLFRLGVLQGLRSVRFYGVMTGAAYAIGVPLRLLEAYEGTRFTAAPQISMATSEVARLAMTLGHVGLVNLLVTTALGATLLRPFTAAGRTALSIYVAQTLICLWVLYPPFMLAWYGRMSWAGLMLTAILVNGVLLIGANLWMRWFRIAPVEWAWRSLIERRALQWRHVRTGAGAIA